MVFAIKGEELKDLIVVGCNALSKLMQALVSFTGNQLVDELKDDDT